MIHPTRSAGPAHHAGAVIAPGGEEESRDRSHAGPDCSWLMSGVDKFGLRLAKQQEIRGCSAHIFTRTCSTGSSTRCLPCAARQSARQEEVNLVMGLKCSQSGWTVFLKSKTFYVKMKPYFSSLSCCCIVRVLRISLHSDEAE